ncbi:hypothetical protein [Agromyces sp. Leaf222]|uniref:hypothetical protein n=1 Tax=Agromyces sp. Leaf222 TaxID=1735688 RepID=UPI0006F598EC|nr:hypothetical protein [Agromyces sp. Leaf222]KQM83942.1 hypothetical protein ASE68_12625 [Agromyces sp. Leaf222]
MTDATIDDSSAEPVRGFAAFESEGRGAIASRAAQLMCMAAFASDADVSDLQDDAALLEVPMVPVAPSPEPFSDELALDRLTESALASRVPGLWTADSAEAPPVEAKQIAWEDIERMQSVLPLSVLLNVCLRSEHPLERVAAAAALHRLSESVLATATGALLEATDSEDPLVRAIANATLGIEQATGEGSGTAAAGAGDGEPVSVTVHGTWGMVGTDPWYRPGALLHDHIRDEVSANLFDAPGYFIWTGGFSEADRDAGARDLSVWRTRQGFTEFDSVYAHSHGGNVALTAAADGERIRLLVLMHTPAIPRADEEWAVIRRNVGRVVVMRTRMDLVVLADRLRTGSRQRFDARLLPHFHVELHWAKGDGWFSHDFFVTKQKWDQYRIAEIVRSQHALA